MYFVSLSRLSWAFGLALLLTGCALFKKAPPSLPALMVERLNWMDDVAAAKRAKGLPIFDPVREAELLRTMTQRGVAAGVQAERVRRFFTGQMQAAKVVQEEWLRQHPAAATREAPDLTGTIRPALDEIGRQMIDQLTLETGIMSSQGVRKTLSEAQYRLTRAGYSKAVLEPAMKGLQEALRMDFKLEQMSLKGRTPAPPALNSSLPSIFPARSGG